MNSVLLAQMESICAAREYCVSDIRAKLDRRGIESIDKEKIIDSLIKNRFIDEKRYAKAFVNDKFRYNGWGRVKISMQLRLKGISQDVIDKALETIDSEEYSEKLRQMLASKGRSVKAANLFEQRAKLTRFALSRGFEIDLIYTILGE